MDVTVQPRQYRDRTTYVPVCPMAKMLARIANQKNLSQRMINVLKAYKINVIEGTK